MQRGLPDLQIGANGNSTKGEISSEMILLRLRRSGRWPETPCCRSEVPRSTEIRKGLAQPNDPRIAPDAFDPGRVVFDQVRCFDLGRCFDQGRWARADGIAATGAGGAIGVAIRRMGGVLPDKARDCAGSSSPSGSDRPSQHRHGRPWPWPHRPTGIPTLIDRPKASGAQRRTSTFPVPRRLPLALVGVADTGGRKSRPSASRQFSAPPAPPEPARSTRSPAPSAKHSRAAPRCKGFAGDTLNTTTCLARLTCQVSDIPNLGTNGFLTRVVQRFAAEAIDSGLSGRHEGLCTRATV